MQLGAARVGRDVTTPAAVNRSGCARSSSAASKRSDVFISSHFLFIHRPGSDCLISNPRQLDARNKPELEPAEENQTLVRDIRWDPNWYKAKNSVGREGMIPENYVQKREGVKSGGKLSLMP
ncbi:hypothetical protein cypCar_00031857 [Cyprinus carpio]|nr:hypothetical protein cypCar_00031857 [Cyprinus carpio]